MALAFALYAGSAAAIDPKKPGKSPPGQVTGTVRIAGSDGESISGSVIVYLEPEDSALIPEREPRTLKVDMKDKTFLPGLLAIRQGDSIAYVNHDDLKHNVFSRELNEFDLGSYGMGTEKVQTFANAGLQKVYCNVHAEMSNFIWVGKSDWSTVVESGKQFSFADLPPGKYTLGAWSIRGTASTGIDVAAGPAPEVTLTIAGAAANLKHRNKYGRPYKDEDEYF